MMVPDCRISPKPHVLWVSVVVLCCGILGSCGPRYDCCPDWDEVARNMPRDWTYAGDTDLIAIVIAVDGTDGSVTITPEVGVGTLLDGERLVADLSWDGVSFSMHGSAGQNPLQMVGVDPNGREVFRVDVKPHESFWLPRQVVVPVGPSSGSGREGGPFFDVTKPGQHTLTIASDGGLTGSSISISAGEYDPREFEVVLDEASCTLGRFPAATGTLTNMTNDPHSYRFFVQFGPVGEQEYQIAIVENLQPGSTEQWTAHPASRSGYDMCFVDTFEIDEFEDHLCSSYHVDWCPQPEPAR